HHVCLSFLFPLPRDHRPLHSFPTRRSSDLDGRASSHPRAHCLCGPHCSFIWESCGRSNDLACRLRKIRHTRGLLAYASWRCNGRSEEHTSELQSRENLVCRLLLEKKKKKIK